MDLPDIERLIPQRFPIRMVDRLLSATADEATTSLCLRSSCLFLDTEGYLQAEGLVEHLAQSASALAGWVALGRSTSAAARSEADGAPQPPIGYIAEVKKFRLLSHPRVGDTLLTHVSFGAELGGMQLMSGTTSVGGTPVAETQMKLFIQSAQPTLPTHPAT